MFMDAFGWTFSQLYHEAENYPSKLAEMFRFLTVRGKKQQHEIRKMRGETTFAEIKSKSDLDSWRKSALARADANLASVDAAQRRKYGASYDKIGW